MSGSITRRGALIGAAAITAVSALPLMLAPANAARSPIGHVVIDDRLADSAAFAAGFVGTKIHHVDALNDLCNRWYMQLRRLVLADTQSIAGLTTWMDYVVMRSCAAEIGYRRSNFEPHPHMVTWVFAPRN
jgi:hypothetical protein